MSLPSDLRRNDPELFDLIASEEERQRAGVELIPSENYTYPEVLAALGSCLTNKYAEGYPGRRYYGGNEFTDRIECLARERACRLFRAEHANVQPLSGSPMNQAVYLAFMDPGDTILAMDLSHGGHLTHGAPVSHMGRLFHFVRYRTDPDDAGRIDFDALRRTARETQPKLVLCGYTSYPRDYDYAEFRRVADEAGALAVADVSHVGGLIAAGALANPFDAGFDVVTTTTHKSLRGPRAGLILCRAELARAIDRSVFPGLQGGPHMNTIAAVAVALGKALEPEFKRYGEQVLHNARVLADALLTAGCRLVTGGTDNHMLVLDAVASFGLDGTEAERTLDAVGITANKQVIPDDPNPPLRPSGVRLGTPAATTRGMGEAEMRRLGDWIATALRCRSRPEHLAQLRREVEALCRRFPVPGIDPSGRAPPGGGGENRRFRPRGSAFTMRGHDGQSARTGGARRLLYPAVARISASPSGTGERGHGSRRVGIGERRAMNGVRRAPSPSGDSGGGKPSGDSGGESGSSAAASGRFIVLEGIDGSGKTEQVRRLAAWLRSSGHRVVTTREPTDGEWGRRYRAWARGESEASADEVLHFFLEDRREHVAQRIRPALARGEIVVSDRYRASTLAYQAAHGLERERLRALFASDEFPEPDLELWLRVPVDVAVARLGQTAIERYERADFLERVHAEYASLGLVELDGTGTPDEVAERIRGLVEARLRLRPGAQRT
jgi:glycine hydroxymethyltransferase